MENEKIMEKQEIRKDFRLQYQLSAQEMQFIKTLQWKTVFYVILLLSGLRFLYDHAGVSSWQGIVIGLVIVIFGALSLIYFQREMVQYRRNWKCNLIPELSPELGKKLDIKTYWYYHIEIPVVMFFTMLAVWLILFILLP